MGKEKRNGIEDYEKYVQAGRISKVTVKRDEMVKTILHVLEGL